MLFTIDMFSSFRQATFLANSSEQIKQLILNAFKIFLNVIFFWTGLLTPQFEIYIIIRSRDVAKLFS